MTFRLLLFVSIIAVLISCGNEENFDDDRRLYYQGYFLLNEGPFNIGTGTVSFLNETQDSLLNQAYQFANGSEMVVGNILQSGYINNENLYLVVNNAHHIVMTDTDSLKFKKLITQEVNNPRYMIAANAKAYITNWGDPTNPNDDYVLRMNLSNQQIEEVIPVLEGPEQLIADGNRVFINQIGGWNYGNQITVLDTTTSSVETTITVGDVPNSMVIVNGSLYVLCGGKPAFSGDETEAILYRIDLNSLVAMEVSDLGSFSNAIDHAENLIWANGQFYLKLNGAFYRLALDAPVSQAQLFIDENFYKAYWLDGRFYGMDAGNFDAPGYLKIYNESGDFVQSFIAGIVPSMIIKNE